MTEVDWHERWREGRIGFHKSEVNDALLAHHDALAPEPARVLVPLCGKSVDLRFLAERGHAPVGVELVEDAARAFFTEQALPVDDERTLGDAHRALAGGGVTFLVGDILTLPGGAVGSVDAVWDRAALVALPEAARARYAARLKEWLAPGGRMLLVSFSYDDTLVSGPPFSVPDDEVRAHFADLGTLTRLEENEGDGPPRFVEAGARMREVVWLLERA